MALSKICGLQNDKLIIRPVEGYVAQCSCLTTAPFSVSFVQHLSQVCKDGKHFVAAYRYPPAQQRNPPKLRFLVINGTDYNRFESLYEFETPRNKQPYQLLEEYRGADFYLSHRAFFYVIKNNKYKKVSNLKSPTTGEWKNMHNDYQDASHIFATEECFYILKRTHGGLHQMKTDDLEAPQTLQRRKENSMVTEEVRKFLEDDLDVANLVPPTKGKIRVRQLALPCMLL